MVFGQPPSLGGDMSTDFSPPQQLQQPPVSLPPIGAAIANAQKPKINWLGILADALAGAAGHQGPYAQMLMLQRQQQMEDTRSQSASDRELQRQKDLYTFQLKNPRQKEPSDYEDALAAAGIKPGTPEYLQHMAKYLQMKENPVWTYTDPTTGALMMGSKTPPQQEILPTLPPGAKPIGGPSPGGSGGFPY